MKFDTSRWSRAIGQMGNVGLLCAVLLFFSTMAAQAAGSQQLSGYIPAAVTNLNLQPLGQLPATNVLHLSIGLPLRNRAALGALMNQIYDPASPNYRHYLTPAQFAAQFGPTAADYQAVINFVQANGLTVTGQHANRALLDVVGSVANIETAFNVILLVYPHPTENRNFYAPGVDPSMALTVPVLQISGLDNYSLPHPNSRVMPAPPAGQITSLAGSEGGQYIGNDFRAAYVPGSTLYGNGQSVALVEYDNYYSSDITSYESLASLSAVTLTNVYINGGPYPPTTGSLSSEGEVALDIETVVSMAPNLSKILVYEGTNGVTAWSTILTQIADDNLAEQISCSWSGGGADPDPSGDQALVQMAMQGQSFFNAVGDSDAFLRGEKIGFPSDSTNATECGGTTLYTTGPGGCYVAETVWNWDVEYGPDNDGVGGSGGVSTFYSIPPWQQGVATVANQGSSTMRNVPDVALTADHVFVVCYDGTNTWFGGTSCAAPLWAAFTALVNQQAASNGAASVGFLNPAVYLIGKSAIYSNCFHDITTGNNEWSQSPSKYSAVPGYDLCTGLGSPNGANLINALVWMATNKPYIISAGSVVSGGLGNGAIDYDDCVLLYLPVGNLGGGTATVVNATLTTTTAGVTITQPSSTYSNIAFGAIATNNTAFQISTSPSFVCGTPIPLTLVVSYTGGFVTNTITMPTCQCPVIQVSDSLSGSSPTQTDWLWPSGTNSTCRLPKACSEEEAAVGTVAYNAYSYTNSSSSAACVSVTITTLCGDKGEYYNSIFSAAYLGSYNPANLCANYLADMGGIQGSFTGPGTFFYSFTVPANTNFTVVVDGTYPSYYCSGYALTVAGLLCPFDGGDACAVAAPFEITSIVESNNNILLRWTTGGLGVTNILQATVGDANGGYSTNNFADIFTVTNTVGTTTNYLDTGAATNVPARYYRVRLAQ
jgi:subtilase family serine protease